MKDYKRVPTQSEAGSKSGFVSGILLGLVFGLVFSAGVHVYHTLQKPEPQEAYACASGAELKKSEVPPLLPIEKTVAGDCALRDRDVYKALLDANVPIPQWEAEYVLQAKSYPTEEEALVLKKKVLNLGYKSTTKKHTDDEGVWYRIEIGPYRELKDVNEVRQHLKNHRIETSVKKQNLR